MPPVATSLLAPASFSWLSTSHFRARVMASFGRSMPASWQARSPRAAYWEFELSDAVPSRFLVTGTRWRTVLSEKSTAFGRPPVAVPVGTRLGIGPYVVGVP